MVEPTTRPSTSPFASGHERTTSSRYSRVLKARREGPASERRFNPRHDACYPSLAPLPHQGLDLRGEGRRVAHARAQDDGRVRLISRNECDHTRRFPPLVEALTKLMPASFTLDGEVAVFDEELISRFEWLRHLNHGDLAPPPVYMVFDLLRLGEKDFRPEPLKVRRKALEKLVKGQTLILPARRLLANGMAAWAEVLHRGDRGIRGQGSGVALRSGTEPEMAQGQGAEVPRGGAGILQARVTASSPYIR